MAIFKKTEPGLLYELSPGRDGRLIVWSPGLMKYKDCTSLADMAAVNSNYLEQDIDDGCWFYQLPSLVNGDNMFYNDTMAELYEGRSPLWHFEANLQSLQSGVNMFKRCWLDAVSVKRIADTLPNTSTGTITLGIHYSLEGDSGVAASLAKIESKGWSVETEYNLQYGFTELEYIEGSGTQYIDTGINVERGIGIAARTQYCGSENDSLYMFPVGAIEGAWPSFVRVTVPYICPSPLRLEFAYGTLLQYHDMPTGFNVRSVITGEANLYGSLQSKTMNNDGHSVSISVQDTVRDVDRKIFLCGRDAISPRINYFIGRIFFAQVTINEKLIGDFIPVLDANNTPCMYDKITRKCFYNAGNGSFIVGMTMRQLPALLYLPTVASGELKLSLPWEAQLIEYGAPAILEEVKNKGWTIVVQYAEPDTESAVYNKYAACTTQAEAAAINPDFRNDLTSEGEWLYPLTNMTFPEGTTWWRDNYNIKSARFETNAENLTYVFLNCGLLHVEAILPCCKTLATTFCSRRLETATIYAPELENGWYGFYDFKGEEFNADFPKMTNGGYMFHGAINLKRGNINLPALSSGVSMFHGSQFDKASVLGIIDSLPTWTSGKHPLTLGIHIDHQSDEEVLAALEAAEAKGWTLTVQWNGTATAAAASTYGLRRPPVYAKLAEPREEEEQMLDWGHYVTNWEENGYTEFASLEEAYAHFGITQQPEEEEVIDA